MLAARRQNHDAGIAGPARPPELQHPVEERGAKGAGQMVAPLAPVEAGAAQRALLLRQRLRIDRELAKQAPALGTELEPCAAADQRAPLDQSLVDAHPYFAGEMIVADPGLSQGRLARTRASAHRAGPEGYSHQRFEKLRDIAVREAEIPVPSLPLDGHEFRIEQLREMRADRLLGDARHHGELGGGERPVRQQRGENFGAGVVAEKRGYASDARAIFHGSILDEPSLPSNGYHAVVRNERQLRSRTIRGRLVASVREGRIAEHALLALLATLWGASYALIRVGVETIPPVTLIAARTALAAAVLLGVLRRRGIALPAGREVWQGFAFQACLNSVVPFTLIAWAEQSVDAGIATILNACSPIFACIIAAAMPRGERLAGRKLLGVATGMMGIVLIVGVQALSSMGRQWLAELAIVAATICYAGAALFGRRFDRLDPMLPATGSLVCGAIVLVPVSVIADRPWALSPSGRSIAALLCLALLSTALAFTIYFRLLRTLGSVGTTAQAYLRVPIGVGIGAWFLDEALPPDGWVGLLCVVAGVAAMTLPAKRRRPDPSSALPRAPCSGGSPAPASPDRTASRDA